MPEHKPPAVDPARSLALLWGSHVKLGRSGLSIQAITTAAIELADTDGLEALSMRRVAEKLGVGTMSLYTHVPGKPELLELMIDSSYSQLYQHASEPASQPGGWRSGLTFIAQRNWHLYEQHPWLLQLIGARPVLGPHTSLKYEAELRALEGIGLTDLEMDAVLTLVQVHVDGTARLAVSQRQAQHDTGLTEAEWWIAHAPLLERVMDAKQFPVASRVGRASGEAYEAAYSPSYAFQFGLERILDGVASVLERRRK